MNEQLLNVLKNGGISLGIILLTLMVGLFFNRLFRKYIRRSTNIMNNDPTNYLFLRHAITAVIYLMGFSWALFMIPEFRGMASSIQIGAGIAAVAVGFASQHALGNIISGMFIIVFKPYRVNDRLKIRDILQGTVEDITLRHTVIRDFENRRIIIPNSVISEEVIINSDFEDDRICLFLEIDINYKSDLDLAKKIMAEEAQQHPLSIDNRTLLQIAEEAPIVTVRVLELGTYGIKLRAWVWAKNTADAFVIKCDLLESIKKRFDQEGVEIPYPHHIVIQRNQ